MPRFKVEPHVKLFFRVIDTEDQTILADEIEDESEAYALVETLARELEGA